MQTVEGNGTRHLKQRSAVGVVPKLSDHNRAEVAVVTDISGRVISFASTLLTCFNVSKSEEYLTAGNNSNFIDPALDPPPPPPRFPFLFPFTTTAPPPSPHPVPPPPFPPPRRIPEPISTVQYLRVPICLLRPFRAEQVVLWVDAVLATNTPCIPGRDVPWQVRVEQVIVSEPGAVTLFSLANVLKFYGGTIGYDHPPPTPHPHALLYNFEVYNSAGLQFNFPAKAVANFFLISGSA